MLVAWWLASLMFAAFGAVWVVRVVNRHSEPGRALKVLPVRTISLVATILAMMRDDAADLGRANLARGIREVRSELACIPYARLLLSRLYRRYRAARVG